MSFLLKNVYSSEVGDRCSCADVLEKVSSCTPSVIKLLESYKSAPSLFCAPCSERHAAMQRDYAGGKQILDAAALKHPLAEILHEEILGTVAASTLQYIRISTALEKFISVCLSPEVQTSIHNREDFLEQATTQKENAVLQNMAENLRMGKWVAAPCVPACYGRSVCTAEIVKDGCALVSGSCTLAATVDLDCWENTLFVIEAQPTELANDKERCEERMVLAVPFRCIGAIGGAAGSENGISVSASAKILPTFEKCSARKIMLVKSEGYILPGGTELLSYYYTQQNLVAVEQYIGFAQLAKQSVAAFAKRVCLPEMLHKTVVKALEGEEGEEDADPDFDNKKDERTLADSPLLQDVLLRTEALLQCSRVASAFVKVSLEGAADVPESMEKCGNSLAFRSAVLRFVIGELFCKCINDLQAAIGVSDFVVDANQTLQRISSDMTNVALCGEGEIEFVNRITLDYILLTKGSSADFFATEILNYLRPLKWFHGKISKLARKLYLATKTWNTMLGRTRIAALKGSEDCELSAKDIIKAAGHLLLARHYLEILVAAKEGSKGKSRNDNFFKGKKIMGNYCFEIELQIATKLIEQAASSYSIEKALLRTLSGKV